MSRARPRQYRSYDRLPPSPASRIAELFGGLVALAKALNAPVSTVQGWIERGIIPPRRQHQIMMLAAQRGIHLEPFVFVPVPIVEPALREAAQ